VVYLNVKYPARLYNGRIDKVFIHGIYCELATIFNETKEQSCTNCKLRFATLATKLFYSTNLIPTKALLKETLEELRLEYLLQ